jgi:GNAT superfamily N-acetyltransferase
VAVAERPSLTYTPVIPNIHSSLLDGFHLVDKAGRDIVYRYLADTDDIERITDMLHQAYAPLAARGMRFLASHQNSTVTRHRMGKGETMVAEDDGLVVGVATLKHPGRSDGSPFYERPDVAGFGQFAVRPSHQGSGIGAALLQLAEERAAELGARHLALDTSEHASDLIALYEAKGFTFVEYVTWRDVNYRSVVMAKELQREA